MFCYFYFLFCGHSRRAAVPEIGNKVSQRVTKLFKYVLANVAPCTLFSTNRSKKKSQRDIKSEEFLKRKKELSCFI